jgi:hypothetical protein
MSNNQAELDVPVSFDDLLLTTKEAADYLNTPANTLSYWRKVNYGPPYFRMKGGHIRYRRGDILEYIVRDSSRGCPGSGVGSRDHLYFRLWDRSNK